ncbi:A/G-specific adenine DNA glycosylase [Grifola frondosa]|uniref:Adenine DNA glycosylase n=1 Tax=Grifola frondosa TaxID=5627 RepID=A0A1C7MKL8_GRIFR|nr:A/G-specific adenine DNA glycosylase [Grifola frondosa]
MAKKRKGVSSDEDDDWFEPVKSARTAKKRVAVKIKRKRAASGDESAEPDDEYEAQTSDAVQTRRHPISMHTLSEVKPLRAALLGWYAGVHASRGMPWRKPYEHTSNPEERSQRAYEVWISEIMLQQTQVATVIPYYNKWMAKFPTIRDLAASDIETVNSLWKGLGYYSRAARLLSGAQKVIQQLGGRLPDNAKDLESKIPGIGRYSAGAICSIAYNQCVPVLDGNVHRLLSRVLALYAPPKAKQTLDILWAGASAFVDRAERPGDLNQALIELGSTVCKVRDPDCDACPLRPWCAGHHYESYTKQLGDIYR